jgi:hypothetical protein
MSLARLVRAPLWLSWSLDESTPAARRGHAYLRPEGTDLRWTSLEHGPDTTPTMLAVHGEWRAAHPATPELVLRRRGLWREPGRRWCFHGDLGLARELLEGRALIHELGLGVGAPLELPQAFVRAPISTLVEAELGAVAWPACFEAPHVCVGPRGVVTTRAGRAVVVCAARPGSIHDGAGQTRTAALWCSSDGGASWVELGWALEPDQRDTPAGRHCWPPEEIERVTLAEGAPVIEWEDPWIDWEPGHRWRGTWDPVAERWRMQVRGSM